MSMSKIPPPPPLRLGGLVDDDPLPTPGAPVTVRSRGAVQGDRARATIVLPAPLAAQLREGARETGRTQADLVLSALLTHYQAVADQVNAATATRASVGLPPLRPPPPEGADRAAVGSDEHGGKGPAGRRCRTARDRSLRASDSGAGCRVRRARRLIGEVRAGPVAELVTAAGCQLPGVEVAAIRLLEQALWTFRR